LSGIGPRDHLESLGIPVVKDLPAVGLNFQDHFSVPIVFNIPMEDSFVRLERRPQVFLVELFRYLTSGTGLLLSPVVELDVFAKSDLLDDQSRLEASAAKVDARDPKNIPDIEIIPIAYDATGVPFDKSQGKCTLLSVILRPKSSGSVRLATSNPDDPLACDLNTMSAPSDWHVMRKALRLSLALARQIREDGYPMTDYRVPSGATDADLDAFITKWGMTAYHYSSTCRMAPEDDAIAGVVDDELRVHGIQGLRVADSSIFPQVIATHLQAATVMVAEKCAELIQSGR